MPSSVGRVTKAGSNRSWMRVRGRLVENAAVRSRIDHLRQAPSAVCFLSIEPLIGVIGRLDLTGIDWVIVKWREWARCAADV